MKVIKNVLAGIFASITLLLAGQCPSGNNTFLGTVDDNWLNDQNWSEGCRPLSPITGYISIEANCILNSSLSYTFNVGSTFQIKDGVSFTKSGSGAWVMNGDVVGGGTFIGNTTLNGALKPGYDTPPASTTTSFITYGGQTYTTRLMPDGRWWMAENLNIGTMINGTTTMSDNGTIEKYCYNDDPAYCALHGGLYQWDEVMNYTTTEGAQGICPSGWHVPTLQEWTILSTSTPMPDNGSRLAGGELQWFDGPLDQSNYFSSSGFAALPSGIRLNNGLFNGPDFVTILWSSSEDINFNDDASIFSLWSNSTDVLLYIFEKAAGNPIRCIQN